MHWDLLNQWKEVKQGLHAASTKFGDQIVSVGVDTWGVDFGLLGEGDVLLGNPVHYRDRRTEGILETAFEIVPREQIFAQTGLQFMQFNTLFQLYDMAQTRDPQLEFAQTLLTMPDLLGYMLSGVATTEVNLALPPRLTSDNPSESAAGKTWLVRVRTPSSTLIRGFM